ncbi:MAG: tRNA lysidine(34) synthetase TilS [Ruminococcus sp.]|nr:tRNA lysidine(34) synthetase TilS [Candidatus Apopatosoma intestinale]
MLPFSEKAKKALAILPPLDGQNVVVGFSGGADSVSLLTFLAEDCGYRDRITAFHVNHMIRGAEADRDEAFCRSFCADRGIAFRSERIDVPALCGDAGVEETARAVRYDALVRCAEQTNSPYIALAHTASDNAETVLFHLARGCGTKGACGIPISRSEHGKTILRPLLFCTRNDVEAYCAARGLPHVEDSTNRNTDYTRSFVRHEIIPRMEHINPDFPEAVGDFCRALAMDGEYLEEEADKAFSRLASPTTADKAFLLSLAPAIRFRVLRRMTEAVGSDCVRVHFDSMEDLLRHPTNGARVNLPGKITAVVEDGLFSLYPEEVYRENTEPLSGEKPLHPGENRFSPHSMLFVAAFPPETAALDRFRAEYPVSYTKGFSFAGKEPALSARIPSPSDAYRAGGITRKLPKLKTTLTLTERRVRPVVCADGSPVWYPGFDRADDCKTEPGEVWITYFEKI